MYTSDVCNTLLVSFDLPLNLDTSSVDYMYTSDVSSVDHKCMVIILEH